MTRSKFFSLVLLVLFVSIQVFAAPNVPEDTAQQMAQVTEFEVNGLKVLIKRRPSAPTVAGGLFIKGGSRNITDKNAGIENLMLASAVEAGKKFTQQTLRREISRTGSGIGTTVGIDYSAISLGTTRPNFDRIWEIFTDVVINPAFNPEDVERNRRSILTGLREAESSPEGALAAALGRNVFSGHIYGNDVSGTPAVVQSLTVADLRAYHQKIMQTSRLVLVLVGDLDPEDVRARVAASFGKLPRGDYKDEAYPALDFSKPTLDVVPRTNLPTNYAHGVFNAPSLGTPDYYAMRVATAILASLVYREVRAKRQLSYAPDADLGSSMVNTGDISVSSTDINQSVSVMLDQIRLLKTYQLDDSDIAEVAGNFLTSYYLGQETSGAQAGELAKYEIVGGGWRNYYKFLEGLKQVRAADVKNVANKYMKNVRFVVVGKPADVDRNIFLQGS
jgi:predicted Zn-dependent peptidase